MTHPDPGWFTTREFQESKKSKRPWEALMLADQMCDYSEEVSNAGWLKGNEFHIWKLWHDKQLPTEYSDIPNYANTANGWWIWGEGLEFLSRDEWLEHCQHLEEKYQTWPV